MSSPAEKFQHKKSLGQHFLTSDVVPKWMCAAANLKSTDVVLEIGPGVGILTKEILESGAKVIAIEADQRAILQLEQEFIEEINNKKLIIFHTDVRELDLETISDIKNQAYKVVANIPYYLSGMLLRLFLEATNQPIDIVFLLQKEVAKRATSSLAKGSKESLLSLSVQAYGEGKFVKSVGRGHFVPPPAVDSGIIAIHNINRNFFQNLDEKFFFSLLHTGFGQKRKQLLGNLAKKYDRQLLINIFSTLNMNKDVRAEDVPLKIWLELAKQLSTHS